MTLEMKTISVVCPSCKEMIDIELPSKLVVNGKMVGIQVPKERCCSDHSFIVFFDENFTVIGYEIADIEFDLNAKVEESSGDLSSFFDVNTLIQSTGVGIASMMLRALLVHGPIYFFDAFDTNDYS